MSNNISKTIDYQLYKTTQIKSRTFSFSLIQHFIENGFAVLNWELLGYSFEDRPIKMVTLGSGKTKLMLWSQMHGDEPTATAAIFDLLNFLKSEQPFALKLLQTFTFYFIPVINPDGLEKFTRRNAQQIDINRDFIALQSAESKILKTAFEKIKPDFAFNLHDQSSLYCTPNNLPVGISFLSPASDRQRNLTWNREQAMKVIVAMNHELQKLIPNQTARFKDDHEPRAFGDNFQKKCPTILIESGYLKDDLEKQYVRELNFYALLSAFETIQSKSYQELDLMNYQMIPLQSQDLFHIKIKNCKQTVDGKSYKIDLGFIMEERFHEETRTFVICLILKDIGDLHIQEAYKTIEAEEFIFSGNLILDQPADLELRNQHGQLIYEWKSGLKV